jgi:tetratricopeptide (TPR) repeat protein
MILSHCFLRVVLASATLAMSAWCQQQPLPLSASSFTGPNSSVPSVPAAQPQPTLTIEMRGDIFMARKMYREAIDAYRKGDPNSAVLNNKIGIAFHQMLQLDHAKKSYEKAIKLNPSYAEAINNLGTVYYAEKSYRRAVGYYKRALRFEPKSASIMVNLGSAYFSRHEFEKASELYAQALAADPEVFERHSQYGELLQERSVEDRAKFHLYLAKTYAKAGENERALSYLRKALEEGVKEREKIPSMPEFAALKTEPAFLELMASAPKPL